MISTDSGPALVKCFYRDSRGRLPVPAVLTALIHILRLNDRPSVGLRWPAISGPATLEEATCRDLLLQNDFFLKH